MPQPALDLEKLRSQLTEADKALVQAKDGLNRLRIAGQSEEVKRLEPKVRDLEEKVKRMKAALS